MLMWLYLPGGRCRLFAYGPADATAILQPHHLYPDWFYLSGTGLPRCPGKAAVHSCFYMAHFSYTFSVHAVCSIDTKPVMYERTFLQDIADQNFTKYQVDHFGVLLPKVVFLSVLEILYEFSCQLTCLLFSECPPFFSFVYVFLLF